MKATFTLIIFTVILLISKSSSSRGYDLNLENTELKKKVEILKTKQDSMVEMIEELQHQMKKLQGTVRFMDK